MAPPTEPDQYQFCNGFASSRLAPPKVVASLKWLTPQAYPHALTLDNAR